MRTTTTTVFALVALAALLLNAPGVILTLSASWNQVDPTSAIRALVADAVPPGTPVFFVTSGDTREASAEWAMRQAIAWETMPAPVPCGTVADIGSEPAVLTPLWDEAANAVLAATGRYEGGGAQAGRRLWTAHLPSASEGRAKTKSRLENALRELWGLLPLALVSLAGLLVGGAAGLFAAATAFSLLLFLPLPLGVPVSPVLVWLSAALVISASATRGRRDSCQEEAGPLLAGAIVFAATALLALAHTYVAPYGLSVTGGKAKLWFLSGLRPTEFFAGDIWKILEPAYPPGCAALTLGCYGASGFCGDWLTQTIPCLFAAATAALMVSRVENPWRRLWLLTPFLTPLALMTAGQFYPEPILALGLLAGWDRIRNGRAWGWLLLGATGWFKNEGLVFLFAAWFAWRLADGSGRARLRDLALALVLPAAWHVGCRAAGASLQDYVAPWRLSPPRGIRALGEALELAFLKSWHYGFAYPAALVAAFRVLRRPGSENAFPRPLLAALLFALFTWIAFGVAFASSTADADWHIRTSLARLLWTPALLLAWECAR